MPEKVIILGMMSCRICGSDQLNLLYMGKDRLHGLAGDFGLYTCANCGVVAVRPQLSNELIEKYYPVDYISYPGPIEQEVSKFKRVDRQYGVTKRRKKIEKHTGKKGGRILDIGCATGIFIREMKEHGWDVFGVEPSTYAARVAVEELGLNVINGYLEQSTFEENYFDVITLWDVFEHLPDPVVTLEIIKRILKPNGSLVITMPNSFSWERTIFGKYWAGWDVPRHYHIFSEEAIKRLLQEHGMRFDKLISFTGMLGAIRISIDFWLQEQRVSVKVKNIIRRFYHSLIFRLLLYPYMIASNVFSKSTSMTIFATKSRSTNK